MTKKRTAISAIFSQEAFRLCVQSLSRVLSHPDDMEARGRMQLGAAFAGTAIENSMLGAAHSAANPLTAHFGVVHGHAVGVMLPAVIRFNAKQPEALGHYKQLAVAAGLSSVDAMLEKLSEILELAQLHQLPEQVRAQRSDIPQLAAEAAKQWTANFNPRQIGVDDFVELYEEVFA